MKVAENYLNFKDEILNESMFPIEPIVKKLKKIITDSVKKEAYRKYESKEIIFGRKKITNLFKDFFPSTKEKIFLDYSIVDYSINKENIGDVLLGLGKSKSYYIQLTGIPTRNKKLTPKILKEIESSLTHEVAHTFDMLREKKSVSHLPKKYSKTIGGYYKSPTEFNSLIHEIKDLAEKKPKQYNEISSRFELMRFLSRRDLKFWSKEFVGLFHNPSWYKKLIKRLNRESLLPEAMKNKINEEYFTTTKVERSYGKFVTVEVFKNPTRKEFKEVKFKDEIGDEQVRYFADLPNKQLYIFTPTVIHWNISDKIGFGTEWEKKIMLGGVATKRGNRWVTDYIDNLEVLMNKYKKRFNKHSKDLSWLDKYIETTPFIKKAKKKMELRKRIAIRYKEDVSFRMLRSELINEDIDINYKKFYSDIPKIIFNSIIRIDPTFKIGGKSFGKYARYLLKRYKKEGNDLILKRAQLRKDLEIFHKHKNKLPYNKDIMTFPNKKFNRIVNQFRTMHSSEKEIEEKQTNKVYEDDTWLIIKPLTFRSCVHWSGKAGWCTARSEYDYAEWKLRGGFYIIINKKTKRRWQYSRDKEILVNSQNKPISIQTLVTKHKFPFEIELHNIGKMS